MRFGGSMSLLWVVLILPVGLASILACSTSDAPSKDGDATPEVRATAEPPEQTPPIVDSTDLPATPTKSPTAITIDPPSQQAEPARFDAGPLLRALDEGQITEAENWLFQTYALFGITDLIPEEFRTGASPGMQRVPPSHDAPTMVLKNWGKLPPEAQDRLQPLLEWPYLENSGASRTTQSRGGFGLLAAPLPGPSADSMTVEEIMDAPQFCMGPSYPLGPSSPVVTLCYGPPSGDLAPSVSEIFAGIEVLAAAALAIPKFIELLDLGGYFANNHPRILVQMSVESAALGGEEGLYVGGVTPATTEIPDWAPYAIGPPTCAIWLFAPVPPVPIKVTFVHELVHCMQNFKEVPIGVRWLREGSATWSEYMIYRDDNYELPGLEGWVAFPECPFKMRSYSAGYAFMYANLYGSANPQAGEVQVGAMLRATAVPGVDPIDQLNVLMPADFEDKWHQVSVMAFNQDPPVTVMNYGREVDGLPAEPNLIQLMENQNATITSEMSDYSHLLQSMEFATQATPEFSRLALDLSQINPSEFLVTALVQLENGQWEEPEQLTGPKKVYCRMWLGPCKQEVAETDVKDFKRISLVITNITTDSKTLVLSQLGFGNCLRKRLRLLPFFRSVDVGGWQPWDENGMWSGWKGKNETSWND